MTRIILLSSILALVSCSPLEARLKHQVDAVKYSDGIDKHEAIAIARLYRLNNMKWFDLSAPMDGGRYWVFRLVDGQTKEPVKSPPLFVMKNGWSYDSAIYFDKSAY
jgi:hypothetical protein